MRDPTRTVLVVTQRPHAWALLRDRLDPALVYVAWTLPASLEDAVRAALPWALACDVTSLPERACEPMRGRLVAVHWVGEPVAGLPTRPRPHADWADLVAALGQGLRACVGGLRLAPAHGLQLPGGRFMQHTAPLEVLLAAHPEGLELGESWTRQGAMTRHLQNLLQMTGAPVELVCEGRRLRLVEVDRAGSS
jgi:hypothetical protein